LLTPGTDKQFISRGGVVLKLTDGRNFFAALLDDMQRQGMERPRCYLLGMQPLANTLVHLLRRLSAKSQ